MNDENVNLFDEVIVNIVVQRPFYHVKWNNAGPNYYNQVMSGEIVQFHLLPECLTRFVFIVRSH